MATEENEGRITTERDKKIALAALRSHSNIALKAAKFGITSKDLLNCISMSPDLERKAIHVTLAKVPVNQTDSNEQPSLDKYETTEYVHQTLRSTLHNHPEVCTLLAEKVQPHALANYIADVLLRELKREGGDRSWWAKMWNCDFSRKLPICATFTTKCLQKHENGEIKHAKSEYLQVTGKGTVSCDPSRRGRDAITIVVDLEFKAITVDGGGLVDSGLVYDNVEKFIDELDFHSADKKLE